MMRKHLTLTMWPLNVRFATKIIEINTGMWLSALSPSILKNAKCKQRRIKRCRFNPPCYHLPTYFAMCCCCVNR